MKRLFGVLMTLALVFFAVRWGSVAMAFAAGIALGYWLRG